MQPNTFFGTSELPNVPNDHSTKLHRELQMWSVSLPLEEKQVEVVVFLCEEVAEDAGGVSTADLISWQAKVNALDKVPELSHKVLIELPKHRRREKKIKAKSQRTTHNSLPWIL